MAGYNITKAIYDKYIVPTIGNHGDGIGVELEIPILNLKKEPVNFSLIQELAQIIQTDLGFQVAGRDDQGAVYSMSHKKPAIIFPLTTPIATSNFPWAWRRISM